VAAAETSSRLIGQLLVESAVLSSAQLEQALAEQEQSGRMLGEIILELGLASRDEIASALAEQSGIVHEQELGFGSGLLEKVRRRRGHSEPVPGIAEGYELLRLEPAPNEERTAAELEGSHLIFLATGGKYELIERPGPPPNIGESVSDSENGGRGFSVVKLARSPLPLDQRQCAYLQAS
jgi:hypothetical protein